MNLILSSKIGRLVKNLVLEVAKRNILMNSGNKKSGKPAVLTAASGSFVFPPLCHQDSEIIRQSASRSVAYTHAYATPIYRPTLDSSCIHHVYDKVLTVYTCSHASCDSIGLLLQQHTTAYTRL